jgi:hypothetical protein
MPLAPNSGLTRSPNALIAVAEAAEQPSEKQRHDGGDVWTSSDGHMDVIVYAIVLRDEMIAGRSMPEGATFGVDAREFRAH